MNIDDLKLKTLGIDKNIFRTIFTFIDYGNVNYWYEKDQRDAEEIALQTNQKLIVDIKKLVDFNSLFSEEKRFYYGWDNRRASSWHIAIKAEQNGFIKKTKPIQFIKHFLGKEEAIKMEGMRIKENSSGRYIEIPKSNFDVEISVDAIRLLDKYNTFCLFSGDSDFTYLASFLKKRKKKFIVVASGQVFHTLKELADLYVNAQLIKKYITSIKETAPLSGRGLDIGSRSAGQGS